MKKYLIYGIFAVFALTMVGCEKEESVTTKTTTTTKDDRRDLKSYLYLSSELLPEDYQVSVSINNDNLNAIDNYYIRDLRIVPEKYTEKAVNVLVEVMQIYDNNGYVDFKTIHSYRCSNFIFKRGVVYNIFILEDESDGEISIFGTH